MDPKLYQLAYGAEGVEKIEGTWEQIRELLEGYPVHVVLDIFAHEKLVGSELYPLLKTYTAMRLVDGFEGA